MAKLNNLKIKVIKKGALPNFQTAVVAEKKLKRGAEREIAKNVSAWITEFQSRRCEESKQSFNQLFALT